MRKNNDDTEVKVIESDIWEDDDGNFSATLLCMAGDFLRVYCKSSPLKEEWICVEYPLGKMRMAISKYDSLRFDMATEGFPSHSLPEGELPALSAYEPDADGPCLLYKEEGKGKELSSLPQTRPTWPDWDSAPWEECPFPDWKGAL